MQIQNVSVNDKVNFGVTRFNIRLTGTTPKGKAAPVAKEKHHLLLQTVILFQIAGLIWMKFDHRISKYNTWYWSMGVPVFFGFSACVNQRECDIWKLP